MKTVFIKKGIYLLFFIFFTSLKLVAQFEGSCSIDTYTANQKPGTTSQPSDCIKFLNDFIPLSGDPVIEIRVKMYCSFENQSFSYRYHSRIC